MTYALVTHICRVCKETFTETHPAGTCHFAGSVIPPYAFEDGSAWWADLEEPISRPRFTPQGPQKPHSAPLRPIPDDSSNFIRRAAK